jgi:hypothetical protein
VIQRVPGYALRRRGGPLRPPLGARARWLLTLVLAAAVASITAPASPADGDPASDYLLNENVYLPYQSPSAAVAAALQQAAASVYLDGNRVKVAVIYDAEDLGAIPSLFGQPSDYAHFLGIELGLWYVGPLLVVMPAGFGIYDGGRSTSAEQKVLQSLHVSAGSPDDLVQSATTALQALAAANALSSPDIKAPLVTAYPASATRGKPATLHFGVFDDSGQSKAVVRIYEQSSLLATLTSPEGFKIGTRSVKVSWPVPAKLKSRQLRFCVVATDPAGNHSTPACAPFLRVS